jgi:hypothetical protein
VGRVLLRVAVFVSKVNETRIQRDYGMWFFGENRFPGSSRKVVGGFLEEGLRFDDIGVANDFGV